jgi:membrane glycosyltransferase
MPARAGRRGALILSHDFVEAALLRRAGWTVRFVPGIAGSYEEPPATLIDYALRDRRWCHGNLQHLRLLGTRGLHVVSRFHLLHGAISYLLSPAWFILLVIWALLGNGPDSVITYFSADNPLYPVWPEMSGVQSGMILLFMYAMLLAPKVMGALGVLLGEVPVWRGSSRHFWPRSCCRSSSRRS